MALTFLRSRGLAAGVGGKVLQVVTATDATQRQTNSTSYVTGSNTLSVSITPSSASNKIFILVSTTAAAEGTTESFYTIFKNGSNLVGANGMFNGYGEAGTQKVLCGISYLDSPATTSSTTYQVYFKKTGGYNIFLNSGSTTGSITAFEIAG